MPITSLSNRPSVTKAAALQYDKSKTSAPKLTVKGQGTVAERIIEVAKANNIPLHTDADLVEILHKAELDTEIPLEVYAIVAEIFSLIYKLNKQPNLNPTLKATA